MTEPTQARLRELFIYDPETGIFTSRKTGKRAGRFVSRGYWAISFDGASQRAGRMAWLYVHGELDPNLHIDHVNGNRADDRIANLRAVTRLENNRNLSMQKNNKSGAMGVFWHSQSKRWRAQIRVDYRCKSLGSFASKEEAIAARKAAEALFGFHPNHGKARMSATPPAGER